VRLERESDRAPGDTGGGEGGADEQEDSQSVLTRIARLSHPHVAAVYDMGVVGGSGSERVRYAVCEWTDGHTLGQLMAAGPQSWGRVANWGRQICAGLAALHEIGVVHGALRPDSIAVFDDRRVKILDTGLERPAAGGGEERAAADDVRALAELLWSAVVGVPFAGAGLVGAEPVSDSEHADVNADPGGAGSDETTPGNAERETAASDGVDADSVRAEAAHDAARQETGSALESGSAVGRSHAAELNAQPLREAGASEPLIELLVDMLAADPAVRPTAAAAERRFAALVPVERVSDLPAPTFVTAPVQVGAAASQVRSTPTPGAVSARSQAGRPVAETAGGRRSTGLIVGLAVLIAAAGAGVGLTIAHLTGPRSPATPLVNVTVSGSAGVISLPTPAATTTSAAPIVTERPTTAAPRSVSPSPTERSASPSASPSPSPSRSPSASASSLPTASPTPDASAPSGAGNPSDGASSPR
jgi:serine/threonine-protein kinase